MGSHEKDPSSPKKALSRSNSTVSSKHSSIQQGSESWEVVEEPRARGSPGREPDRQEGYLLKKRKWPLKGWHKRYFVLENGILKYATTRQDVLKGKLHGAIDVRQSVMSVNKKAQRVDLDTEENIYHLKIKSAELFASWVSSLCSHHQGESPDPLAPARKTPTSSQVGGILGWTCGTVSGNGAPDAVLSVFRVHGHGSCPRAPDMLPAKGREQQRSQRSIASLADSHTEFFDACEVFLSASSSENEVGDLRIGVGREGSANLGGLVELPPLELPGPGPQHRSRLPAPPAPPGDVSLWGLLRSSVGKDLSRVALPVQLNEPLNTLQRLCEELEYSTLLDRAARARDPRQRLVYVAAFAVSAYASTFYRAGSKPFNPVLGETYECVRPDRGFRFISEQVSHHPPISACHAESDNFIFWQDMRWKNKFWGKSLEIVPVGTVNVRLPRSGDHFEWNKVTTCIHNVLSGPRWIEHYGEVLIRNTRDASYHCKITFCKARYWGAGANEVQGAVLSRSGAVVERLAGKWHEGLFRGPAPGQCVWRANPMPTEHERNYGFTQFALELNELTPELRRVLPSTDTRLRPDQRYLEEGNVAAAEAQKRQIEQLQRDRRRVMEENNITHQARFFSGKESWVTNNTYWKLRLDPGFAHLDSAVLW
uniref:Oxysterol-binding protein n=1 Tax=Phasianus colchicus TaxID=9054 RepID=A0A669QEI8_PHACC